MPHVLLVSAPYYKVVNTSLLHGAVKELETQMATYELIEVPGAFEIPSAIAMAYNARRYDGFVALGCVIRGETSHYDHICASTTDALQHLATDKHIPLGNGILTVETITQAEERANPNQKNKGGEAVKACLAMIEHRQRFIDA